MLKHFLKGICPARGRAESCYWKGPDTANGEGYVKDFGPLCEEHGESTEWFKTGKWHSHVFILEESSVYSKNEVERAKWKLGGQ